MKRLKLSLLTTLPLLVFCGPGFTQPTEQWAKDQSINAFVISQTGAAFLFLVADTTYYNNFSTIFYQLDINGDQRFCSIEGLHANYIPDEGLVPPGVIQAGWQYSQDVPFCNGNPAVSISIYCPPGSIAHSDSDFISKFTASDGTHRFVSNRDQSIDSGFLGGPGQCWLEFDDGTVSYQLALTSLTAQDGDRKEK